MKFWTDFRPATGVLAVLVWFLAVGATAQTTNTLSDAEIQGRALAQQLCDAKPETNFTNRGVLNIRSNQKPKKEIAPVVILKTIVGQTNWLSTFAAYHYEQINSNLSYHKNVEFVVITHVHGKENQYQQFVQNFHPIPNAVPFKIEGDTESHSILFGGSTMTPFGGSDFWIADLGLEFFHWPLQKVLPKTTNLKRGRDYTLLESTNPNPATNGYSRVLSWIDKETGGILEAEAYDFNGKLLKDFAPKSFKKVNGQWELQEMEIRNVQTGSRTRLEFDLKP